MMRWHHHDGQWCWFSRWLGCWLSNCGSLSILWLVITTYWDPSLDCIWGVGFQSTPWCSSCSMPLIPRHSSSLSLPLPLGRWWKFCTCDMCGTARRDMGRPNACTTPKKVQPKKVQCHSGHGERFWDCNVQASTATVLPTCVMAFVATRPSNVWVWGWIVAVGAVWCPKGS